MRLLGFFVLLALVLFFARGPRLMATAQAPEHICTVTTPSGLVRGLAPGEPRPREAGPDRGAGCTYLGVPYAAPPIGNLRWKPPQPVRPWTPLTVNAISPRQCAQISVPAGVVAGTEDCLLLNVWTPLTAASRPRPVLVWFHTGAFQAANALNAASVGERLAQERDMIVVAPNYRLGPFGFLAHGALTTEDPTYRSSGNYGLLDQRAALGWVRDHIAAFGGDPQKVTIAGTSAGSHSVSFHLVSPASAGLFHRAIIQSGSASFRWPDAAEAEAQGDRFARALGCIEALTAAACLRSRPTQQVLRALPVDQQRIVEPTGVAWGPTIDGVVIPDQPRALYRRGAFNRVPLMIGVNRDDGWTFVDRSFPTGFDALHYEAVVRTEFGPDGPAVLRMYPVAAFSSPKDALAELAGDAEYLCEARRVARFVSQVGVAVYAYVFEYTIDAVTPGRAFHGLEPNLLFGNDFAAPSNHVLTAADLAFFRTMSGFWRRFAEAGDPNASTQAGSWPLFRMDRYPILSDRFFVLNDTVRTVYRVHSPRCDFWERFSFRSLIGPVPASAR